MTKTNRPLPKQKTIALVAHDSRKEDLVEWVKYNRDSLRKHRLVATGTTGKIIEAATAIPVRRFISGPLGGDQQIGSEICSGQIHMLFFLWDPLSAQPHDPDVKALLRIATLWNIPLACNRSSADFLISSPLLSEEFDVSLPAILKPFMDTEFHINGYSAP